MGYQVPREKNFPEGCSYMIVYLGMPKCASTWIWEKIRHNFDYKGIKEPHTLVELGEANNNLVDFSTNNWSMDSSTAKKIDNDVSNYIFIIRDPVELATSYYKQTAMPGESFNDFVYSLVKTKLICFGDIIERWYNLVDSNKILIYDYNKDIANNQELFMNRLCKDLNLNDYDQSVPLQDKVLETKNKPTLECDQHLLDILKKQMDKFQDIVK
jgi:hypothetical protein